MRYFFRLFLGFSLFSSLLLLSACGFHLKGMGAQSAMTFQTAKVETSGTNHDLLIALESQLKFRQIKLVNSMADANVVIRLGATQIQRTKTGSTATGNTGAELVKMIQPFSALDVKSDQMILSSSAKAFRDRNIDESALLTAERELRSLTKAMAYDLASQVIDRINRSNSKRLKLEQK